MARDRLDVAKKQHRERGQLKHRQRLGLLEKHADYVKRAKDFHSKEDRIKKLRQKAATKNKDEFYFGMVRGKTQKGVHIQDRGNEPMPVDVVKLLKTQDAGYVRTLLSTEENIIGRLKNELACTVAFQNDAQADIASDYGSDSEDDDDKGEGTSKQRILELLGAGDVKPKKTVFVDSANDVMKWKPKAQTAKKAAAYKGKGKAKQQSAQAIAAAEQAATRASEERKARLLSLTEELEARNERLALLQRTFREMQVQRAVMGKGSKNVVGTKTKGLSREDARLNQDDLDELELKRALNQKVKLPEPGIGLATGARVWKWKAERRR